MKLKAVGSSILFKFVDETHGKFLGRTTQSGILVATGFSDQKEPKWGEVLSVGDRVEDIKVGEFILIEALAWTPGMYIDNDESDMQERIWRTDESRVLAVSEEKVLTA